TLTVVRELICLPVSERCRQLLPRATPVGDRAVAQPDESLHAVGGSGPAGPPQVPGGACPVRLHPEKYLAALLAVVVQDPCAAVEVRQVMIGHHRLIPGVPRHGHDYASTRGRAACRGAPALSPGRPAPPATDR